ncbi:TAP-like protein [Nocardiopsis sp. Huas11]|uniref:alpha/beta fold hydrolase n=1 Tax=Nocardiopsis sp. Huas11 TaxID=2183912 RepID=UPI000EADC652|nr:alpha/beta fold hydrolase [Nocardiopsis sp. Huas11]RKS10397.1 TAP-like protein [Nocardiopsis sp. Huas11]
MRRARTTLATAVALTASLAASLAVAAPVAAAPDSPPIPDDALARFHDQEVDWRQCEEDLLRTLECADIEVPLDYADPEGPSATVAISRRAASDSDRRRGILLTNPGGPGQPGRLVPVSPEEVEGVGIIGDDRVAEVYDLIGMDPRGTGASTPRADCGTDYEMAPPRPDDAEFSGLTRSAIAYQRACAQVDGDVRPHLSTANTARDMDVVRAALGEDRLNYLGWSYGTYLGAVYGSLFPDRLDRSVLDSAVHPDLIWRDVFTLQAPAYSSNVERYTAWLAEHDDLYDMGATPEEVVAAFEETARRLAENPREDIPGLPEGQAYGNDEWDFLVGVAARYQGFWDVFTQDLAYFVHDVPFPEVAAADDPEPAPEPDPVLSGNTDLQTAVLCETGWPSRVSGYYRDMREVREEHPFGIGVIWHAPHPCTFDTAEPVEPLVELERDGYPTGLVIAGEFDAQTAYVGGPALAERLDAPLLTVEDEGGHGFYGAAGLDCVTEAVDAYLVEGAEPADLTCPGMPVPDPRANGTFAAPDGDSGAAGEAVARARAEREAPPLSVPVVR